MKIHVSVQGVDVSPSVLSYINKKFSSVSRFIKDLDKEGQVRLLVEIGKTTKHHRHGDIYKVAAVLELPPKKILRADEKAGDLRVAIDIVKNKLSREITKHKVKITKKDRRGSRDK